MSAITALTEDFTGAAVGTAVSTANTIFDNVYGTAIATIITDPFLGGSNRMMEVSGTSQDKYMEMDFTATGTLWFNFDYSMVSAPSVNTMILQGYINSSGSGDTGKIFDVRANTTRAITLRNVTTAIWTSTALTANTKYRIFVGVSIGGSTKTLRCVIYNDDGTTKLQDSGDITVTNAATSISHLRIGTLLSSTFQHRFGRLRGDDATGPDAPTPPPTGGITTLDTVAENFTGAANGVVITESNTIFSHVSGEGTSAFATDPVDSAVRAMQIDTVANDKYHHVDFTAVGDGWVIFDLEIATVPDANLFLLQVWADSTATTLVSELRILANTRTVQIRNASNIAQWTSSTLAAGVKHRIAVQSKLGATASARTMRVMILSGGSYDTVTQDSGNIASNTTAATFAHFRIGHLTNATATTYIGRIRGSLVAPAVGNSVNLGVNQDVKTGDTVSFTVDTTGTGSLSLTQTAGPPVTLSVNGASRSFVMPGTLSGSTPSATTVTFSASYGGATDSVSFLAPAHDLWLVMADGSRKPINRTRYVP